MLLTPAPAFEYPIFIDISSPSGIYTESILHVPLITLLLKSIFVYLKSSKTAFVSNDKILA